MSPKYVKQFKQVNKRPNLYRIREMTNTDDVYEPHNQTTSIEQHDSDCNVNYICKRHITNQTHIKIQ